MKVNGYKCESCFNLCDNDKLQGWLFVRDHETNSSYKERHFCSLHCLHEWVEKCMHLKTMELKKDMDATFEKLEKDKLEKFDNHSHMKSGEFKVTQEDIDFWRDN